MQVPRPLRFGLVGGGPGAFIGAVHRRAAELDGDMILSAGLFSRNAENRMAAAQAYGVSPERSYSSLEALIAGEQARRDGIDFLVIASPNDTHRPFAEMALRAGMPVFSDKPAARDLEEARHLAAAVQASGKPYALTYSYSGYPMVRLARALCSDGRIGAIRKVSVEYSQGWMSGPAERQGNRQAAWRSDPKVAGKGGCIGDIGVHAFHLVEFVTGRRIARVAADLSSLGDERVLDDDCNMLFRLDNDAPGVFEASQIAVGERNSVGVSVYGTTGAIHWRNQCFDRLEVASADGPTQTYHAGEASAQHDSVMPGRLPSGHPEGFIEAMANLYRDFAAEVRGVANETGTGILEGVRSMAFIEAALASSRNGSAWMAVDIDRDCGPQNEVCA